MEKTKQINVAANDDICVVCYREAELYSIGECDHPVCHECSTRMRVLCNRTECPICRKDLALVVFMKHIKQFSKISYKTMKCERRYSIFFENDPVMQRYDKLLEHVCSLCGEQQNFKSFSLLKDHMRKVHENFYCDLCVENLKIFTHERKVYSRSALALHRRVGDSDDTSHRGHPLCEFCDSRFMDNDELFRHLRRDHYFCHFCDADGLHHYYMNYEALRRHFSSDHFLCEEDNCREERFTSVFRTKIDMQAHKAQSHGQGMSRLEARQARTVDVAFNVNSNRPYHQFSTNRDRNVKKNEEKRKPNEDLMDQEMAARALPPYVLKQQEKIDINCAENFPSLGNTSTSNNSNLSHKSIAQRLAKNSGMTVRSSRGNPLCVEDFPSLSTTTSNIASGGHSSTSPAGIDAVKGNHSKQRDNSDIIPNGNIESKSFCKKDNKTKHLSHSSNSTNKNNIKPKSSSNKIQSNEDFPALPKATTTTNIIPATVASWIPHNTIACSSPSAKSKKVEEINNNIRKQNISDSKSSFCLNKDFPSLVQSPRSSMPSSKSLPSKPKGIVNSNHQSKPKGNVNNKNVKEKNDIENMNTARLNNSKKDEVPNISSHSKNETIAKNKKKKNLLSLVLTQNSDDTNGPVEDFSATREGEYEAVIPNISSNINLVSSDDILSNRELKKKGNAEPALNFSSNDFPSLVANKLSISTDSKKGKTKCASTINKNSKTDFPVPNNRKHTTTINTVPPGFVQHPQLRNFPMSNSQAPENSMKKTITDSFTFPPNFDLRNRALIDSVKLACNGSTENFTNFKITADKFRKNECSGEQFYGRCRNIMGKLEFLKILPELLALLPDIVKQQAVLKAYQDTDYGEGCDIPFTVCGVCRQVLILSDFSSHMTSHDSSPPDGKRNITRRK